MGELTDADERYTQIKKRTQNEPVDLGPVTEATLDDLSMDPQIYEGGKFKSLIKWKKLQNSDPFEWDNYFERNSRTPKQPIKVFEVRSVNIGNYIGQLADNKRHGAGRLVVSEPEKYRNTIIEGQF